MEFGFVESSVSHQQRNRRFIYGNILSTANHLPDTGPLSEKSIKKSSSSNAIRLRNRLEGASAEYKKSKYLWDDTGFLVQTPYGQHEVPVRHSGKDFTLLSLRRVSTTKHRFVEMLIRTECACCSIFSFVIFFHSARNNFDLSIVRITIIEFIICICSKFIKPTNVFVSIFDRSTRSNCVI